jgi:hypothetical protein
MRKQDVLSGLEVIDTNHILKGEQRFTMQGIEGGLQALVQVFLLRLSLQSTLIGKLLSLCRISFKLGNFVGQPISFRLQRKIVGRKIVYLCFQRRLVGGSLSSNSCSFDEPQSKKGNKGRQNKISDQMEEEITYGAHLLAGRITAGSHPLVRESSCISSISP